MAKRRHTLRACGALVVAGLAFAGACASPGTGTPQVSPSGAARATPSAPAAAPANPSAAPAAAERPTTKATRPGHLLVRISHPTQVRTKRGSGRVLGTIPTRSPTFGIPTVAWVRRTGPRERWGRVNTPYTAGHPAGWIPIQGLAQVSTPYLVRVDLSAHTLTLRRRGHIVLRVPTATGAPSSPTPTGAFWVTDRVHYRTPGIYGRFAFGLSAIQTDLPPDWNGGNQIAIHGTPDPASIGTSSSSGCLRVSGSTLTALRPRLRVGTPVVIRA